MVGVSFLGGEPVFLSGRILEQMGENGLQDVPLVVGGVMTPEMVAELRALGVDGVFTPGTKREELVRGIADILARRKQPGSSARPDRGNR